MLPQGIGLVEVSGTLLGGDEIDQFRDTIRPFLEGGCQNLIIDLDGVTHMNSIAVGVLVSTLTSYVRRNWRIKLCGVNKVVYSVLAIVKLNNVFEIERTREDAIRGLTT